MYDSMYINSEKFKSISIDSKQTSGWLVGDGEVKSRRV